LPAALWVSYLVRAKLYPGTSNRRATRRQQPSAYGDVIKASRARSRHGRMFHGNGAHWFSGPFSGYKLPNLTTSYGEVQALLYPHTHPMRTFSEDRRLFPEIQSFFLMDLIFFPEIDTNNERRGERAVQLGVASAFPGPHRQLPRTSLSARWIPWSTWSAANCSSRSKSRSHPTGM